MTTPISVGATEIDLYTDFDGNDADTGTAEDCLDNDDLYADLNTSQAASADLLETSDEVHREKTLAVDTSSIPAEYSGKRISMYVGELTWWTTDADLANAIQALGIVDLLEIKFHENRVNGQSKGFAVVVVGSETSSRTISDRMRQQEIHGQTPKVLPCNKQSLSVFEGANTHKDGPVEPVPAMHSVRPMMRPSLGPPLTYPSGGSVNATYRFPPRGPMVLSGSPSRAPMHMSYGARGPMPGSPMVFNRMSSPALHSGHLQQPIFTMQQPQRSATMTSHNGAPLVRHLIRSALPVSAISGQPSHGYYPVPRHAVSSPLLLQSQFSAHVPTAPGQPYAQMYYRTPDVRRDPADPESISQQALEELVERQKTLASGAIVRAVQDACAGDYAAAIETLVTCVSLIKQSKVGHHERCQIIISSLEDTRKGIEDKSYGQHARHRSRSESPRQASRKKHRPHSRSPGDRNEHHSGRHSREHRRR